MGKTNIAAADLATRLLQSPQDGTHSRRFKNLAVQGNLDLSQAKVSHAVILEDCTFDGNIVLIEATFPQLSIIDSRIGSELQSWRIFDARHLNITEGDLRLDGTHGIVDIQGAHIRDDLHLERANLHSTGSGSEDFSFRASNLDLGGNLRCSRHDVVHATSDVEPAPFQCDGPFLLSDTQVGGSVYLADAILGREGALETAAYCDGMTVGGSFYGHRMTAFGQVRLVGCVIKGSCELHGAYIWCTNNSTPSGEGAVMLDRAEVHGSLFCCDDFVCRGGVHAVGCHINASAEFNGAVLLSGEEGPDGVALLMDRSVIGGRLSLKGSSINSHVGRVERARRMAIGGSRPRECHSEFLSEGMVSLCSAEIRREVAIDIEGIRCCPGETEHSGPLADLTRLHTTILFVLGRRGHAGSFIDFTQARMSVLWDHENSWSGHHDVLKGLQYEAIHMADVNPENRLKWMSESSHYSRSVDSENLGKRVYLRGAPAPQPYNQLASAYRSAGDDAKARTVLLRKHQDSAAFRDQSQGATVRFFLAAWNRLQDYTFGYGYRPFRAFCSLLAIWAAGVFIFYWHPPIPASPDQGSQSATNVQLEMNWADHLAYPADRIIPFANLMEDHWVPSDDITTFIAYTLTVLGWIFSAVVIAGVTRFLKRE